MRPTHSPVLWVLGTLQGYSSRNVKLTAHLEPVTRLRVSRAKGSQTFSLTQNEMKFSNFIVRLIIDFVLQWKRLKLERLPAVAQTLR